MDNEKYLPSYLPEYEKLIISKGYTKIERKLARTQILLVEIYKSYYKWQKHILVDCEKLKK